MNAEPLPTRQTLWLLFRMAARRFRNRLVGHLSRLTRSAARTEAKGKRRATPAKRGLSFVLILLLPFLLAQGFFLSWALVRSIVTDVREGGSTKITLSTSTYHRLNLLAVRLKLSAVADELGETVRRSTKSRRYRERTDELSQNVGARPQLLQDVERLLKDEILIRRQFAHDQDLQVADWMREFENRGMDAFCAQGNSGSVPAPTADSEPRLVRAFGWVFVLLAVALFFSSLGSANQDLGKVDWTLEWLYTFPLKTRDLLLANVLEYTILHAFSWFTVLPFTTVFLWFAGFGLWSCLLAPVLVLYFNTILASARVFTETVLRKTLSPSRVKNLQALFSIAGIVAFYFLLYLGMSRSGVPTWFEALIDLPTGCLAAFPLAWPALFWLDGFLLSSCLLAITVIFILRGALAAASRFLRSGLLNQGSGAYQGRRGQPLGASVRLRGRPLLRGLLGKEVLLLRRDRNLLAQTLIVPLLIIGFQIVINPGFSSLRTENMLPVSLLAFGVGAYVLIFSGFSVLTSEAKSLWLLYTVPRDLTSLLRQKAILWASVSGFYVVGTLSFFSLRSGAFAWDQIDKPILAIVGVVILAFIAAGFGVLGTDPLATSVQRRMRPALVYLYMFLSSLYSFAIFAPTLWQRAGMVVLTALLAVAVWQKVEDRLPFLLDPTAMAPPRVGLSDGLIAALSFFCLQGITVMLLLMSSRSATAQPLSIDLRVVTAFAISGAVVVVAMFANFLSAGVPDLPLVLGFKRDLSRRTVATPLPSVLIYAVAASAFAIAYLAAVNYLPGLRDMQLDSVSIDGESRVWFVLLAVLVAPPFEEFIFRALVFRGMRRSLPLWLAATASAAIFALVHPPLAVVPVFGLGLACAFCFERTGLLLAPILVHMIYNAVILTVQFGFGPN